MDNTNIRVLLVEDEKEVREEYKKSFLGHPMLQLVAEVDNSKEALEILRETPIDAMLLDLELGSEDSGVILLEKLQMMDIEKPFIAIVTNVVSKVVYHAIRKMGADYICNKGDNYSLDIPLSIIEISAPYRARKEKSGEVARNLNMRTKHETYRRSVRFELTRMGFPEKLAGTGYLIDGIMYLIMNDEMPVSITKELYPSVALKHQAQVTNVERNIRIAIERVWTDQSLNKLKELYPFDWNPRTGRPTNAEFLYNMKLRITQH